MTIKTYKDLLDKNIELKFEDKYIIENQTERLFI